MTWTLWVALPLLSLNAWGQALYFDEGGQHDDPEYLAGTGALDAKRFDEAIQHFNRVIGKKAPQADGAFYWKAYALDRAGRRREASSALAELRKAYPRSHWSDDAQALQLEIQAQEGKPVSPEAASSEELKLIALNSLMQSDPDRALPILKQVLAGNQSAAIKDKALFVLSQSGSPEGKRLLLETARGKANPDLQMKAVRYIGMMGSNEMRGELSQIYNSSTDFNLKREIIRTYLLSGGGADKLVAIAKSEKDPELRKTAIATMGITGASGASLADMYRHESDDSVKTEILQSLFIQQNAKELIQLAKQEKKPEMKRRIVQQLSLIESKETTDYMMEILK